MKREKKKGKEKAMLRRLSTTLFGGASPVQKSEIKMTPIPV